MDRPNRKARAVVALVSSSLLVAAVAVFSTIGAASTNTPAQIQYAPQNYAAPVVTGEAREGATLTTTNGSWNTDSPTTYSYKWQRCEAPATPTGCADIPGATANTYVLTAADVGKRIRSLVTATNASGSGAAASNVTAVVASSGPAGQIRLPSGQISIPASSVTPPARLVVENIQFSQMPIRSRDPLQARFRIRDTRGFVVRDALVYVTAIPFGRIVQPAEVRSDQEGWATVTIQPTRLLPLRNGFLLTMFVRARKEGDNVLAGVSSRRLISVRTARPTA
ncbi:MAG TPA: hypothetical protein VEY87_05085 [Gaiellaceae bacterium]|jgi:hypothetical protein|nr:hypothetical protein [Gaiellaceae bacterium]